MAIDFQHETIEWLRRGAEPGEGTQIGYTAKRNAFFDRCLECAKQRAERFKELKIGGEVSLEAYNEIMYYEDAIRALKEDA